MKKSIFFLTVFLLSTLTILGQTIKEIAKTGINSTVSIIAMDKFSQPIGYGSAFIVGDELIATNVHVIEGCISANVIKNDDQKKYKASGYIAIDRTNDLIILKVPELHGEILTLGSLTFPEIGEKIYAIGNPKGFSGTFSEGIISGIREIQNNQILQITAPISPGSSGGPVLNLKGQVIGIAFASIISGQNLNFAIPVKNLINLMTNINTKLTCITLSEVQVKSEKNKNDLLKDNLKGKIYSISKSVYNVIEILGESKKGDLKEKSTTKYDANGNQVEFIQYDADGNIEWKNTYQINEEGNQKEINRYNPDGSLWLKFIYKLNELGNDIEMNEYLGNGILYSKSVYKYDEKGNKMERNEFNSNGNLKSKDIYKFDDFGNQIEWNWYDSNYKLICKTTSKYDKNKNEIENKYILFSGSREHKLIYKYVYDDLTNWIIKLEYEDDKPQVITERQIEYY